MPRRDKPRRQHQPSTRRADHDQGGTLATQTITSLSFRGPVPPPADLRDYEAILPGAADRILTMAEKQGEHRQQLEQLAVGGDSRRSYLGLGAGFIVSLAGFGLAGYIVAQGFPTQAVWVAGGNLAVLVGVFVYGTATRRAERLQKAKMMRPPGQQD